MSPAAHCTYQASTPSTPCQRMLLRLGSKFLLGIARKSSQMSRPLSSSVCLRSTSCNFSSWKAPSPRSTSPRDRPGKPMETLQSFAHSMSRLRNFGKSRQMFRRHRC